VSGMSTTTAAERLRIWADELLQELLPVQSEPGTPVLLACDDETIRVVADRLGIDSDDPSGAFARDVGGRLPGRKDLRLEDRRRRSVGESATASAATVVLPGSLSLGARRNQDGARREAFDR
jgi:hypothetical protein